MACHLGYTAATHAHTLICNSGNGEKPLSYRAVSLPRIIRKLCEKSLKTVDGMPRTRKDTNRHSLLLGKGDHVTNLMSFDLRVVDKLRKVMVDLTTYTWVQEMHLTRIHIRNQYRN